MTKALNALTDLACRSARPAGKDYQLAGGGGLALVVRAGGSKSWLFQYREGGRKRKVSLGSYPEIGLADARRLHAAARRLVETGKDPAKVLGGAAARGMLLAGKGLNEIEEAARPGAMTFAGAAARYKAEWIDRRWKDPEKGWVSIRLHLLPVLGELPLASVDPPMLREVFESVREKRGVQAALHARGAAARVLGFAMEAGWCKANPAAAVNPARIGERSKRERYLKAQEVRRYLACLYQSESYRGYKLALHLLLMLCLRKSELTGAHLSEIDLEAGEWRIPAGRMKAGKEHVVFLPTQAREMLKELMRLGGGSEWLIPMATDPRRPMRGGNLDGAHMAAANAAGIDDYHIHDHRHTASTLLRDDLGHLPEVVETALSHAIPGMAGTYSHAQYKAKRLAMLQEWADYLDSIMNERAVIQATFRKVA